MHHVSQELAGRVANLEVKLVLTLQINVEHSLVSFQEGKGSIMLQIEVKCTDNLLLEQDELLASDLLAEQGRQPLNHHIKAWVHVLVHLGSHQDANRSQLNQVRSLFAFGRQDG